MMSVVGLVLHPGRDCTPAMGMITDWARDRDVTLLGLDGETKRITGDVTVCTPQAMAERANLLVSLGRVGFLAEVDVPELADALSAIDSHQFTTESRAGVSAAFGGQRTPPINAPAPSTLAFNDIA